MIRSVCNRFHFYALSLILKHFEIDWLLFKFICVIATTTLSFRHLMFRMVGHYQFYERLWVSNR